MAVLRLTTDRTTIGEKEEVDGVWQKVGDKKTDGHELSQRVRVGERKGRGWGRQTERQW